MGYDRGFSFLSILNEMEFHLVQNRKEDCHHNHIPLNMKGNGILVFSVYTICLCVTRFAYSLYDLFMCYAMYLVMMKSFYLYIDLCILYLIFCIFQDFSWIFSYQTLRFSKTFHEFSKTFHRFSHIKLLDF